MKATSWFASGWRRAARIPRPASLAAERIPHRARIAAKRTQANNKEKS